jgi:hypothetical protein
VSSHTHTHTLLLSLYTYTALEWKNVTFWYETAEENQAKAYASPVDGAVEMKEVPQCSVV